MPYTELSTETKCDLMILEPARSNETSSNFWERLKAAVVAGEIEICDDKVHKITDAPLIPAVA